MSKHDASQSTVETPGNNFETQKTAEKNRWEEISIGQRKPCDRCPQKTHREVPGSENMPQLQGATYGTKPFKLLLPIAPLSCAKKHVQDLDEPGKHQKKLKTGFIPIRHTKKSAQIENRMKAKCDAEVTHVRSTAKTRPPLANIVPGSSSLVLDGSTRKQSSINITASDWSTTNIASTSSQVIESSLSILPMPKLVGTFNDLSNSLMPVGEGRDYVDNKRSSVEDINSEKKAPTGEKKWPGGVSTNITIFEESLKQEPFESGPRMTTESVTSESSCESVRSAVSSVSCIGTGNTGDSRHAYRRSVRAVSNRSRRDRMSKSRTPSPMRNNASVKSGYHISHRSGKERVASRSSGKYSQYVSSRVASRRSTRYHKSRSRSPLPGRIKDTAKLNNHRSTNSERESITGISASVSFIGVSDRSCKEQQSRSRSQSPQKAKLSEIFGIPWSNRSEKEFARKRSSHASPSSSSICDVTSSRSQKPRISSTCDVKKSTRLNQPCNSMSMSSGAASFIRNDASPFMSPKRSLSPMDVLRRFDRVCRSRSMSISASGHNISARLKSPDSGRSGIESIASSISRKSSLSWSSYKCVSSGSNSSKGSRSASPCNVETSARLSKSCSRIPCRSESETGQRDTSTCSVKKFARLSKPGSSKICRLESETGPRDTSTCNVKKSARLSKPGSRKSCRSESETGPRETSTCNFKKSARLSKPDSRHSYRLESET